MIRKSQNEYPLSRIFVIKGSELYPLMISQKKSRRAAGKAAWQRHVADGIKGAWQRHVADGIKGAWQAVWQAGIKGGVAGSVAGRHKRRRGRGMWRAAKKCGVE